MKRLLPWVAILLMAGVVFEWFPDDTPIGHAGQNGKEMVVLLHGLARTRHSMSRMERALTAAGYTVCSMPYASTEKTVKQMVDEDLIPFLAQCQALKPVKIHFVTHSLGGIMLRQFFAEHTLDNAGRIVMLGPPNQGSEVVDKLGRFTLFRWINGPAGQQLGTSCHDLPCQLPIPPVEVGVIAGTRSINGILSCLIPGRDDGKVSVERAKLAGMADFVTVPVAHPFLMRNRKVINLTLFFLQNGFFDTRTSHGERRASS